MIKPTTYASCFKEWELTKDAFVVKLKQKDTCHRTRPEHIPTIETL
jgi:hypothetical protein